MSSAGAAGEEAGSRSASPGRTQVPGSSQTQPTEPHPEQGADRRGGPAGQATGPEADGGRELDAGSAAARRILRRIETVREATPGAYAKRVRKEVEDILEGDPSGPPPVPPNLEELVP